MDLSIPYYPHEVIKIPIRNIFQISEAKPGDKAKKGAINQRPAQSQSVSKDQSNQVSGLLMTLPSTVRVGTGQDRIGQHRSGLLQDERRCDSS